MNHPPSPPTLIVALFLALSVGATLPVTAGEPIRLWAGDAPGDTPEQAALVERFKDGNDDLVRITDVSVPTIQHSAPADGVEDTGACVVIAPGGGYGILAFEHEGTAVAEWLNGIGVHAVLLKYRVPRRSPERPWEAPLQDAQRAIGLVRQHAEEWGVDPDRVGMLGFSAGGNLTAWTGLSPDGRSYDRVDEADDLSCRPDFIIPIYVAYLADSKEAETASPVDNVTKDSPPTFLAVCDADRWSTSSLALYSAMKEAGAPVELHVFAGGRHGFGLDRIDGPAKVWPDLCEAWMRDQGFLED